MLQSCNVNYLPIPTWPSFRIGIKNNLESMIQNIFLDPLHYCLELNLKSVLRINDILVWIRIWTWIRGSMPLTNGSGSSYLCHWPLRFQQKTNFLIKFFCLLLFEDTFTSFLKDKKSKRSHKAVGIKVFLAIFAWW